MWSYMAVGDRATLNSLSQLMLRGFERRFDTPSSILKTIARKVQMKDAKTDQISNFIPMNFGENTAEKDLVFPFAKDYNETDDDRHEYNITFANYDRDPSKIGGDAVFNQDYRTGMHGAALLQEQIAYKIFDTVLGKAPTATEIDLLDDSETGWERPLDDMSLFRANDLRQKLRLNIDAPVMAIVPMDIFPLLSLRFQKRQTDLGDQAYGGVIYDRINNVKYMGDIASPVKFTLNVGSQPAAGDTLTFGNFSNHSAITFIANTAVAPKPGEVKLGASASATKTNIIDYLTDQERGEAVTTDRYGTRLQYDFSKDTPDARNLQRQELRFVKYSPAGADLIVYGSSGRIEPRLLASDGTSKTGITTTNVKGIALLVTNGGMARYKVFDNMKYRMLPREKNLSIMNHQLWGTHGTFVSFGEAPRFLQVDLDYSSTLTTRLGRAA